MSNGTLRWMIGFLVIATIVGCASQRTKPSPEDSASVATAAPSSPDASQPEIVYVTSHRLNLRADSSTQSQILDVLPRNQPIAVLARKEGWLQVQTDDGKLGWVSQRYTTAQQPPKVPPSAAEPPRTSETTSPGASPATTAALSREAAVVLYDRYRQTLEDGDFDAFLDCIYAPARPKRLSEAGPNQKDFALGKDLLLQLSPDLNASQILKYESGDKAAILVARTDLENKKFVTLGAVKFAPIDGRWKVLPKFYDDTFPSESPEEDQAAIEKALEENAELQIALVISQVESMDAAAAEPPAAPAKPSGAADAWADEKVAAATPGQAPGADFADGFLEIDGEKISLKHAFVALREDPFEAGKTVYDVTLTDIAASGPDWQRKIESAVSNGEGHYVQVSINESQQVMGAIIRSQLLKNGYLSTAGGQTFEAGAIELSFIEGTVFKAPTTFQGQTFGYRVDFRAKVRQAAEPAPPKRSTVFNDSPEHAAIIALLEAEGETEILQTASSIGMLSGEDFATAAIEYQRAGDNAQTELYLLKGGGDGWKAYREIPTHRDHPAVFLTLGRRYCRDRYPHLQGVGYADDTWKNTDPRNRTITLICSELIDQKWHDHRMRLVYAFDPKRGWHITEGSELDAAAEDNASPAKPIAKSTLPAQEAKFSDQVVDRFFLSILEGDMDAVNGFIEAGMSPNVKRPRLGHSPLYAAILGRRDPMALLFLELGGDPNFRDDVEATPLLRAAGNCESVAVIKALVAAGADVNAKAKGGGTPLMIAEAMKCSEIAKILREAGAK